MTFLIFGALFLALAVLMRNWADDPNDPGSLWYSGVGFISIIAAILFISMYIGGLV